MLKHCLVIAGRSGRALIWVNGRGAQGHCCGSRRAVAAPAYACHAIAGNGISKLFLTIAAAFAEAERDRIRERIGQVKADQKSRGRYLGGTIPFGYRLGDDGELVPQEARQEAIAEMVALRAQGRSLSTRLSDTRAATRAIRLS